MFRLSRIFAFFIAVFFLVQGTAVFYYTTAQSNSFLGTTVDTAEVFDTFEVADSEDLSEENDPATEGYTNFYEEIVLAHDELSELKLFGASIFKPLADSPLTPVVGRSLHRPPEV